MSQENVELARGFYRLGDPSRFFELLDEEVEVDATGVPILPDHPKIIRGKSAVVDYYRHYWGTWDEYLVEPVEIIDAGTDRVLVVHQERGRGKGSGVPFENRWALTYTFREGKVARIRFFNTREEALKPAGPGARAMPEENVEVVRRVIEAFNRRDWETWEAHHHNDAQWHDFAGLPGGGVHRGVGAIRAWIDEFLEIMGGLQGGIDGIESLGQDHVLLVMHFEFAGRASGVPIQGPLVQLFDLEDRRVRRVRTYRSSAEALEAAGLGD